MVGSCFSCSARSISRSRVSRRAMWRQLVSVTTTTATVAIACLAPVAAHAQHDAFLQCATFTERNARVQCLENALEQAVQARAAEQQQPASATSLPAQTQSAVTAASPASAATAASVATPASIAAPPPTGSVANGEQKDSRRFDLFGWFDHEQAEQAKQEKPDTEAMQASVAQLSFYKPDVLTITLDNGQIWRQRYARRYNLREGDAINIFQSGWGSGFRLEAERFSGFIQVERLR